MLPLLYNQSTFIFLVAHSDKAANICSLTSWRERRLWRWRSEKVLRKYDPALYPASESVFIGPVVCFIRLPQLNPPRLAMKTNPQ